MRPTARQLAMRDPALAALMGVAAITAGASDFGVDARRIPQGYGGGYRPTLPQQAHPTFGSEFGDDFGVEFGDEPQLTPGAMSRVAQGYDPGHPMAPQNQAKAVAIWNDWHQQQATTDARRTLLEPNRGSHLKVERMQFSLSTDPIDLTGTLPGSFTLSGSPDTNLRPQRVTMNALAPGFVTIGEIKAANVSVTSGTSDAWEYNPNGVGQSLDMPTLTPSNKATVLGGFTGYIPSDYAAVTAYTFIVTFKGPASLVA